MTPKLFIDTNVVLDLLLQRSPFLKEAQIIFSLAQSGKYKAYVSSLTFCNAAYILRKIVGNEKVTEILRNFSVITTITTVDSNIVLNSISEDSKFSDIEDGMQYYSALQSGCQYLITRNIKDFKESKIPVLTPKDFIEQFYSNLSKAVR